MKAIRSVCVYCGSSTGRTAIYADSGRALGRILAERGIRIVYGGGSNGIMGAVAEGALSAGGAVTGIIPRFLMSREASEPAVDRFDEFIVTEDMHQRKHAMFENSDAFVAMPGGIGTLEELVEIMTWAQLARHEKPIVLANIAGFWNPLLTLLDHMRAEGFVHTGNRVRPLVVESAEAVADVLVGIGRRPDQGAEAVIHRL